MNDQPKTETTHDRGLSWPTVSTVNLMLRQLERDRKTPYWSERPHADSLDGAEAWLLSLRDWLSSSPDREGRETEPVTPTKSSGETVDLLAALQRSVDAAKADRELRSSPASEGGEG